jgi:hypothetical protein
MRTTGGPVGGLLQPPWGTRLVATGASGAWISALSQPVFRTARVMLDLPRNTLQTMLHERLKR